MRGYSEQAVGESGEIGLKQMCRREENCNNQAVIPLYGTIAVATVLAASAVRDDRMCRKARMWKYDALQVSDTCLSKDSLDRVNIDTQILD